MQLTGLEVFLVFISKHFSKCSSVCIFQSDIIYKKEKHMERKKTVPYQEVDLEEKLGQSTVPHSHSKNTGAVTTTAEDIEGSGGVLEAEAGAAGIRESE